MRNNQKYIPRNEASVTLPLNCLYKHFTTNVGQRGERVKIQLSIVSAPSEVTRSQSACNILKYPSILHGCRDFIRQMFSKAHCHPHTECEFTQKRATRKWGWEGAVPLPRDLLNFQVKHARYYAFLLQENY